MSQTFKLDVRSVLQRRSLQLQRVTPSFSTYGLRSDASFSIDPFLNLDDFVMSQPTFPPHPHAGFSAVTYMFEDSSGAFLNRDSLGDSSRIEPGALHWTQAARGMLHEEVPEHPGTPCHGLQMFVNIKDEHKLAAPAAFHASRTAIPNVEPKPGVRVRVLAGSYQDVASPLTQLLTPITLLEIHLAKHTALELEAPRAHNAFAMTLNGRGAAGATQIEAHEAVLFGRDADLVRFEAGPDGLHLLFGNAAPIGEPVVFGGPFVMTSPEAIHKAQQRFTRGDMGALKPSF